MDPNSNDFAMGSMAKTTEQMSMLENAVDVRRLYGRFNFQLYIELGEQRVQSDNHEKRLQAMRKECDHLKATEWQYDPIEKHIGQA